MEGRRGGHGPLPEPHTKKRRHGISIFEDSDEGGTLAGPSARAQDKLVRPCCASCVIDLCQVNDASYIPCNAGSRPCSACNIAERPCVSVPKCFIGRLNTVIGYFDQLPIKKQPSGAMMKELITLSRQIDSYIRPYPKPEAGAANPPARALQLSEQAARTNSPPRVYSPVPFSIDDIMTEVEELRDIVIDSDEHIREEIRKLRRDVGKLIDDHHHQSPRNDNAASEVQEADAEDEV